MEIGAIEEVGAVSDRPRTYAEAARAGDRPAKLTPKERQYLFDNDGCFYCRETHSGHRATNCPKKKGKAPVKKY